MHMNNWQTFSTQKNKIGFLIALCILLGLAIVVSLMVGSVDITPIDIIRVLIGQDSDSTVAKIILFSRIPRVCASLFAGAALAVSGMVIQTVLNNPLASPSVIGVNSSAGFAVALICAIAPQMQIYTPFVSFLGALGGVCFVMMLSQSMAASKITVVLAGVAISNFFSAGIDAVVTFVPDAINGVTDFRIGGFDGVTMEQLNPAVLMIIGSIVILCSLAQQLDVLSLGSDTAKSLGLAVRPMQMIFLVLAAALAGAAVSFSGLLGFIGLIVPHIMRQMIGEESRVLLISSAMGGALFVVLCDLIARTIAAPFVIPVGIVLAFTGTPFFLWLLFKQRGGRT